MARFSSLLAALLWFSARASAQVEDLFIVAAGGQTAQVREDGSFKIFNVPAADNFGEGGPGTPPDFVSDEVVRVKGVRVRGGVTRYAVSEGFRLRRGQTARVGKLTFSETPPPFPESIRIAAPAATIAPGQSLQLTVLGLFLDGSEIDVTGRDRFTAYRASNPEIAAVNGDGLVTGRGRGTVFITAVNNGATAVKRLEVRSGTVRIAITGSARLEDGSPVAGALVSFEGKSAVTAADGSFVLELDLEEGRSFTLVVTATIGGRSFRGTSAVLAAQAGTILEAGAVVLQPQKRTEFLFGNPAILSADPENRPNTEHIAAGDVDGDGDIDLGFFDDSDGQFGVLLNHGDGVFAPPRLFSPLGEDDAEDFALADLDGDGDLDAAAALRSGSVAVAIGEGDGTFANPVPFPAGPRPFQLILARLDGDADLDIAVTNRNRPGTVSILLGAGDGTFGPPAAFPVKDSPEFLDAGDLDGDGDEDLLVGHANLIQATLLFNDGSGRFPAAADLPADHFPACAELADIDGDADLDALLALDSFNGIAVARNRGDGTFEPTVRRPAIRSPTFLRAADLDGDQDLDLAVLGEGEAAVLFNDGRGDFADQDSYVTLRFPASLEIADLTGDGVDEFIVGAGARQPIYLIGEAGGRFDGELRLLPSSPVRAAAIADLDGDGDPDLAAALFGNTQLLALLNRGSRQFDLKAHSAGDFNLGSLLSGDLDGDGLEDLLGLEEPFQFPAPPVPRFIVYFNDGAGSFLFPEAHEGSEGVPLEALLGDLENDGDLDLALLINNSPGAIALYHNDGIGRFAPAGNLALGQDPKGILLAQLDQDQLPDLVAFDQRQTNKGPGSITVFKNAGGGSFDAGSVHEILFPQSIATGDRDGDGDLDLLVLHSNFPEPPIAVLDNDGEGGFSPMESLALPPAARIAAADADGDGDLDLFAFDLLEPVLFVHFQEGGAFAPGPGFGTGPGAAGFTLADLDGDGDVDGISNHVEGLSIHFNRRLQPGGLVSVTVQGAVLLPDGSPAAGARVRAPGGLEVQTGADGSFQLAMEAAAGSPITLSISFEMGGQAFTASFTRVVAALDLQIDAGAIFLEERLPEPFFNAVAIPNPNGNVRGLSQADLDQDGDLDIFSIQTFLPPFFTLFRNSGDGLFEPIAGDLLGGGGPPLVDSSILQAEASDFDGDGDQDVALLSGSLSILLNQGGGVFGDRRDFPLGPDPNSLALADLDGDGDTDAAAAIRGFPGSLVVVRNRGDGSFGDPERQGPGNIGHSCAAGDLDQDGDSDLLLIADGDLAVLLNSGGGSFVAARQFDHPGNLPGLQLGDLDRDGDLDLVMAEGLDAFVVFKNPGDGNFAAPLASPAGHAPALRALGDLDGDGDLDLATANTSNPLDLATGQGRRPDVAIHLNQGDGSFIRGEAYALGFQRSSLIAGDYDRDGDLDLALGAEDRYLAVLQNSGGGRFLANPAPATGILPVDIAVADFDGDRDLDLATANQGLFGVFDGAVSILENGGGGAFAESARFGRGATTRAVLDGDVDGDSDQDLALLFEGTCCDFADSAVQVLLNDGAGDFAIDGDYRAGLESRAAALGDLDQDGDLDLAVVAAFDVGLALLLNQGAGRFGSEVRIPLENLAMALALGDVDRDGKLDLAAVTGPEIEVFLNLGGANFSPPDSYPLPIGFFQGKIAFGELDGLPGPDILVSDAGYLVTLENAGDGTFTHIRTQAGALGGLAKSALADLDGDGDLDAACANLSTLAVFFNNGKGIFQFGNEYLAGFQTGAIAAADLNGDGAPDLAAPNFQLNQVLILINQRAR
ncbi:MAG: VCBS repeat-containing protein [Planctomycetes bacterium]|nr:VCBS repeat-containing protein [Planctomycetota bacterium]